MKSEIHIIDGNNMLYRAHYGIQNNLSNSKGFPTNAIFGFMSMLVGILSDYRPRYACVVFDAPGNTFRHDMYELYKAARNTPPEQIVRQRPFLERMLQAFGVRVLKKEGVEADDVIATITTKIQAHLDVVIVSCDKDLLQLVNEDVHVLDTMKSKRYKPKDVIDKLGVPPELVADALGLMGDSSDNIPGVPGIGPKTAEKLLNDHGSLESILESAPDMRSKRGQTLQRFAGIAKVSKQLATLRTDLTLGLPLSDLKIGEADRATLEWYMNEFEMRTLWARTKRYLGKASL